MNARVDLLTKGEARCLPQFIVYLLRLLHRTLAYARCAGKNFSNFRYRTGDTGKAGHTCRVYPGERLI